MLAWDNSNDPPLMDHGSGNWPLNFLDTASVDCWFSELSGNKRNCANVRKRGSDG